MLSKVEKERNEALRENYKRVYEKNIELGKELEFLKEEKDKQLKEFNARTQFVEGLLSHMLAKPITIVHPDGAIEHKWQPVPSISGEVHRYLAPGRY